MDSGRADSMPASSMQLRHRDLETVRKRSSKKINIEVHIAGQKPREHSAHRQQTQQTNKINESIDPLQVRQIQPGVRPQNGLLGEISAKVSGGSQKR